MRVREIVSVIGAASLLFASQVRASVGLQNGIFATNGGSGQLTVNTTLGSWTGSGREGSFGSQTTPPVFVFSSGSTAELSTTGASGDTFMGTVKFYGATASPALGVVIGAAGDPAWVGGISQTIGGLTVGNQYTLGFNWASAQEQGFSGNTTEDWQVNFGASSQSTSVVSTPSQTFVGWKAATMTFTADSTSDLLKFTAIGSPSGEQPWLLLNNVTLGPAAVPEPASMAVIGIPAAGLLLRRRRVV